MSKQLEYHVDRRDGVMLIQPIGRLDSSQIARFQEVVMGQVQTGRHDVILDFEQLTFLSSSALRILLGAGREAKKKKNAFLLCGLRPHITDLMKTAGFDRLLQIRATTAEAIRYVAETRGTNASVAPADSTDEGDGAAPAPAAGPEGQDRRPQPDSPPGPHAGADGTGTRRRVGFWRRLLDRLARALYRQRGRLEDHQGER